jgi:hypothetical protein
MKKNLGDGGSYIKTLLRDTKNAAVEDGATMGRLDDLFLGLRQDRFTVVPQHCGLTWFLFLSRF